MAGFLGTISGQVRLDTRQAVAAYAALRAQNARTVYALRGTGDAFVRSGQVMGAAGLGLVYIFGKAVNAAAEFERKLDFFSAVSNTTAADMDRLREHTLDLARDTIYSAGEIADGFVELGKAGVTAQGIIDGIGKAMADLGAAGDIPLQESGQIITSTIQQFDLAASDAVSVVDLLAGAANASIADITDIGVSLKYVGGVANAVGLTFEDTATAISLLAKAGIRGSTAGTSLRQMLVSLGGATEPARDVMRELGIMTEDGGNKFFDAEGKAKSLSEIFQILQNSTADLTAKERLMALRTIFNNRALAAASILTREGAKGFKAMNLEMSKTTAADVAAERLDNLSGDLEILRGNIETLMIEAGSPFQETLRGWVQDLTRLVQVFGELDPGTQKAIVQFIGLSGVILTALGVINIIIGTLLRFGAHMLKLGAGVAFLVKWFRSLLFIFGIIAGGAVSATFLIIAGAVIALVAAFILLYKKVEPFRNFINGMASSFMDDFVHPLIDGVMAVVGWFQNLPGMLSSVWSTVSSNVSNFVSSIVGWFQALPGRIGGAFSSLGSTIGSAIGAIVGWFQSLPGRVMGVVSSFVSRVTQLLTFRNIGYAIGFMVGTVVRLFVGMAARTIAISARIVTGVLNFFRQLPGRVAAFTVMMVARAVAAWNRFRARVIAIAAALIARTIAFFARLPGRIAAFVANTASRAVSLWNSFRANAVRITADLVASVINWFARLPGRVVSFVQNMYNRARQFLINLANAARNAGRDIYNGIVNGIAGLPGAVGGIIGNMISAFRGAISSAAAAVRDFAAGMWKGFKDGLGISSPSYIEEAMWQITGVLDEETKKIAKKTMDVQKLSKQMAATQFSVGDTSGTSGYAKLARDHGANRNRSKKLMTASSRRPSSGDRARDRQGPPVDRLVSGELDLTPSGRAFIRGVAQETIDDNSSYDDSLGRMG